MTVTSTKITAGPYAGNGVSDTFSYGFGIEDKSEIVVFETDDNGFQTTLTVDTDYTVNGVGDDEGTVTRLAGPLPTDYEWYLRSNYPETQDTEFESQGGFFPEIHEKAMDKLTRIVQQVRDTVTRSMRIPDDYSGPGTALLPEPKSGYLLRWLDNAFGFENVYPSDLTGVVTLDQDLPKEFANVNAVIADLTLTLNKRVNTRGRNTIGDGGEASYIVVPGGTGSHDNGMFIDIDNGFQIQFIGDTINSKHYNALTDGSDTSESMQSLFDSLVTNIEIVDGVYVVQGLTLGRSLSGKGLPTLELPDSASVDMITTSSSDLIIEGIKFDGNGFNNQIQNGAIGIQLNTSPDCVIRGCEFTNFYERHVMTDGLSEGLKFYDNIVHDSDFESLGSLRGDVVVLRSGRSIVQNNEFYNIGNGHCVRTGIFPADAEKYVENVVIDGNTFQNTKHVGCTLEEWSRYIVISNNTFDNLEQAVKCERSNNVCSDITITGNTMSNIYLDTALNLSVPRVIFSNNVCNDILDGPTFGDDFICSDNYFADSGRDTFSFLTQRSGSKGGVISGNIFKDLLYRAINVADDVAVTGNTFKNLPDTAINVSGENCTVTGNTISNVLNGVVFSGSSSNCVATGNSISNVSNSSVADSGTGNKVSSNAGVDDIIFEQVETVTNALTVTLSSPTANIIVTNEADAASVDVDTINGTSVGQIIILRANANAELQTYKDGTGNIQLAGSVDFVATSSSSTLTLLSNGVSLLEISRSHN